ncbi:uncharacterized protein LOC143235408 [Tachypleus tridentatus]|uniref:uncharacterized protein LOC143235408 n=1 Tax=Tachypleus tridentatus TaxID=6853 RepID=UPI003FD23CB4
MASCTLVLVLLPVTKAHSSSSLPECECSSTEYYTTPDWLETDVVAGFRIWQLLFLSIGGLIILVILLCCAIKIRIPRTKQEIEIDYQRKMLTRSFREHLDRLALDEVSFVTALEKVKEVCDEDVISELDYTNPAVAQKDLLDEEILIVEEEEGIESEFQDKPIKSTQFFEELCETENKEKLTVPDI